MKPFYVNRFVDGQEQDLFVNDWYYQAWSGCYCLIKDKDLWG